MTTSTSTSPATRTRTKRAAPAAPAAKKDELPLGKLIDNLFDMRAKRAVVEAKAKDMKAEECVVEEQILERLHREEVAGSRGKKASAFVTQSVVAQVTDWDAFHAFIGKKKMWHLLQRRTSDAACREMFTLGKNIPGVEPFTKVGLSITTLRSN